MSAHTMSANSPPSPTSSAKSPAPNHLALARALALALGKWISEFYLGVVNPRERPSPAKRGVWANASQPV